MRSRLLTRPPSPAHGTLHAREKSVSLMRTCLMTRPPSPAHGTLHAREKSVSLMRTCLMTRPPSPAHGTLHAREKSVSLMRTCLMTRPPSPAHGTLHARNPNTLSGKRVTHARASTDSSAQSGAHGQWITWTSTPAATHPFHRCIAAKGVMQPHREVENRGALGILFRRCTRRPVLYQRGSQRCRASAYCPTAETWHFAMKRRAHAGMFNRSFGKQGAAARTKDHGRRDHVEGAKHVHGAAVDPAENKSCCCS